MTVFQKAWNLLKIGYIPSEDARGNQFSEEDAMGRDSVAFTVKITVDYFEGTGSEEDAKDRFMAAIHQAADMEEAFYNHNVKVEFV